VIAALPASRRRVVFDERVTGEDEDG
jgi:hypothetical protein